MSTIGLQSHLISSSFQEIVDILSFYLKSTVLYISKIYFRFMSVESEWGHTLVAVFEISWIFHKIDYSKYAFIEF